MLNWLKIVNILIFILGLSYKKIDFVGKKLIKVTVVQVRAKQF